MENVCVGSCIEVTLIVFGHGYVETFVYACVIA